MESLLKQKNKKPLSIYQELLRYTHLLFMIVFIMIIASMGVYSLSVSATAEENSYLFMVNNFYTNLLENKNLLYNSIIRQDVSACENILSESESLLASLEPISKLNISSGFRRDIQDISKIMENYQEKISRIIYYMNSGSDIELISKTYYEAETIYYNINNSFHSIYTQVIESCQQNAHRMSGLRIWYTIVLVITVLLLIYYLILRLRIINQKITAPIQNLIHELQDMNLQNFRNIRNIAESSDSNRDIYLLIHVYNSMLVKIQKQLLEREEHIQTQLKLKEQELLNLQISNELKKSQLLNLQTQINPHFLFNTLNMISQSAYLENDRHTVKLLETTSDFLRYVLDYSDKSVSLAKEIKHLGDYVYLQKQRFGKRMEFQFDLDESFHWVQIPNLILQPIVENAIIHGIGMYTEGGKITIETKYLSDKKMGRIRIIDNGIGMDANALKRIDREMRTQKESTGKIGLYNVFFRLSIFFDHQADIILSSIPCERTEVALYIPCHPDFMEVDANVSNHNC